MGYVLQKWVAEGGFCTSVEEPQRGGTPVGLVRVLSLRLGSDCQFAVSR